MKELYEWSEFTYLSHAWPHYTGCYSETHQASCYETCCMMNFVEKDGSEMEGSRRREGGRKGVSRSEKKNKKKTRCYKLRKYCSLCFKQFWRCLLFFSWHATKSPNPTQTQQILLLKFSPKLKCYIKHQWSQMTAGYVTSSEDVCHQVCSLIRIFY